MNSLDNTTKYILGVVLIIVAFIVFKMSTSSNSTSESGMETSTIQEEVPVIIDDEITDAPVLSPTFPLVTGFSGNFSITTVSNQSLTQSQGNLLMEQGIQLSRIQTDEKSYFVYSSDNQTHLHFLASSKAQLSPDLIKLTDGRLYIENRDAAPLNVQIGEASITIQGNALLMAEPLQKKARVFSFTGSTSLSVFGKKKNLNRGQAVSIFFSRSFISDYNLVEPLVVKASPDASTQELKLDWVPYENSTQFYVFTESKDELERPIFDVILTSRSEFSVNLGLNALETITIFSENKFGSWSLPARYIKSSQQD